MIRLPLLAAVAVCLGCAAPATREFVIPPGALLEVGAREYQPGDVLLLKSGAEYVGTLRLRVAGGGDAARPVEVASDGAKPATIQAGDGDGICFRDSGVTVRNLILKGRSSNLGVGVRVYNDRPQGDKRAGIRLMGLDVSGFGRAGIMIDGRPQDKSDSGFKDVLIESCKVYDGVHYGIWSNGFELPKGSWKYPHANITVRGCETYGIVGDPNKHDNHSGNGILIGSVDGALIERCCAHDNGARNGSRTGGPVGIWTYCARKVVIQHCESYANRSGERPVDGGGFDLDGGVTESVMQYNYSHDNDGAGYLVYSYKDAPHEFRDNIVRFNVSIHDGRRGEYGGIVVGHHDDQNVNSLIHHNLVVQRAAEKGKACALIIAQTKGLKAFNNVFVVQKGGFLAGTWGLKPGEGLEMAGNTWLVEGPPALLQGNDVCSSLEEWLKKGSLEAEKNLVLSLQGNVRDEARILWPRDVATLGDVFKLRVGQSSAVEMQGLPATDFLGRKIGTSLFAGPFSPR